LEQLAVLSDVVAIARVGAASPAPAAGGGALALWIERALKGRLQSRRDIVWVPRLELPKAEPGPSLWLLFLAQAADGSWHVQNGGRESNLIKLAAPNAPVVAEVAKYAGACGAAPEPEGPDETEIARWIQKAGKGGQDARREALDKLFAAGDSARAQLQVAALSQEREVAAAARTVLPLTGGGPAVNALRLILEPASVTLQPGERRQVTVNLANLSGQELKVVVGQSTWGENVLAAAAYEVRFMGPESEQGAGKHGTRAPEATVLPKEYGVPQPGASKPLPLVREVPAWSATPLPVELALERATVDGKEQTRLKFPHGHIDLPQPGKYSLRAHFDCPGPRPGQQRLLDANYWRGGQLVSNEIVLIVTVKSEPRP